MGVLQRWDRQSCWVSCEGIVDMVQSFHDALRQGSRAWLSSSVDGAEILEA